MTAAVANVGAASGIENRGAAGILAEAMSRARVPGAAAAYLEDCKVVRIEHFGTSSLSPHRVVSDKTGFEAASLSKPVFAYLVMKLVDRGLVDLDEPIASQLPYPRLTDQRAYQAMTPRMVLGHRTGLPSWAGRASDHFRANPLDQRFAPGTAFGYSGEGYQLLQTMIEKKSGLSLQRLFARELQASMPRSTYVYPMASDVAPAFGFDRFGSALQGRPMNVYRMPNAAYSFKTVIGDYAQFLSDVCARRGLSQASYAQMLGKGLPVRLDEFGADPAKFTGGTLNWTLGWGHQHTDADNRDIYFHWGDNRVFENFVAFDPRTRRGVVLLTNGANGLSLIEPVAGHHLGSLQLITTWLNFTGKE